MGEATEFEVTLPGALTVVLDDTDALDEVRAGDTITTWSSSRFVTPNYVLGVERDGPRLSIDLADNYGHPFPGNPLSQQAREWVQVQRGPASEQQEET